MNPSQLIVVVDDNHDDLFILKRLLSRAGLKNAFVSFDHAADAKRFLEAAIRTPDTNLLPAAIFTDKQMPEMNGFDLLKWVREQPQLKKIPFFMLTSSGLAGDATRAKQLRATRFMEKFPPHHIFSEIFGLKPKPGS